MLTPQDIENKIFKVAFKGYSTEEVDDFLQEVCDSFVSIYLENKKYKEQNALLSEAVEKYKSMEGTLKDALCVADKSSSEIEQEAYRKAGDIITEAENKAAIIIDNAKRRVEDEKQKLDYVKAEMEAYKEKIRGLIEAQTNILNGYPAFEIKAKAEKRKKITKSDENTERLEIKVKSDK